MQLYPQGNYRKWAYKYLDNIKDSVSANWTNFALKGVFAGLILSGFITSIPPVALGVALGVSAGISLVYSYIYSNRYQKMKDELEAADDAANRQN